jgi:hypothetical protein
LVRAWWRVGAFVEVQPPHDAAGGGPGARIISVGQTIPKISWSLFVVEEEDEMEGPSEDSSTKKRRRLVASG